MVNNLKTQEEKQKKAQEIFSYLPTDRFSYEERSCLAFYLFKYHAYIADYTAILVDEYFNETNATEFEVLCNGEATVLFDDGKRHYLGIGEDVIAVTLSMIGLEQKVGFDFVKSFVKYYAKDVCKGNDLSLQNCLYDIMRAVLLNNNPNYVITETVNESGIRCLSIRL